MNFNSLTIKGKLLLSFSLLAIIALSISALSLRALSQATDGFSRYLHGINARAEVAAQVRTAVDRRAIAARNLVLVTRPEDLALENAAALRAHEDVQAQLAKLKDMVSGNSDASDTARNLVREIGSVESRYGPVAIAIADLALAARRDEAIVKMNDECRPLLGALVKATDAYTEFTKGRQADTVRKLEEDYAAQRNLLIVMSIAAVALAAVGGLLITRSITRPMQTAVDVAQTVARGDLSSQIAVVARDETGRLLSALRDMNERLTQIVSRVRQSSASIAGASAEIAAGNADLSQRTEEQAASLEETAASMEELTTTVRLSSENARQANDLAREAADIAQSGSTAVGRVVDTMQGISASSTRIADITGMIEGIAFQTNILALNAAVEAARAGEQGRGFAVVASEVRSLAQRSSSAAKEIKELIAGSLQQIQNGATLAGEAGQTMNSVTRAVARVSSIVEDIASASMEQSRGIEQVNQAISQMDQVTQQNAAMVEQAASASRALQEQGQELNEAVAFFRLPGAGGAGRPHAPASDREARRQRSAAVA
ncbi:methyl-accepting chemotaxis protein [Cupriavidus basilensis]|uniref:Methyl-accepting chemotaxis protein I (Serine chemoreceptor protein) n=1 Tax=Cupriavidus basilensis TaxID=68895 RepID=A0A0C4YVB2_9BURK|nr:methyl-accepting chemotaxis protein [Cupriavidus basilensis]AJG24506.1 Methyl-accepting chemotaxis protein I (serine chemoreceptor protein) [Cupriavidus basilensis]